MEVQETGHAGHENYQGERPLLGKEPVAGAGSIPEETSTNGFAIQRNWTWGASVFEHPSWPTYYMAMHIWRADCCGCIQYFTLEIDEGAEGNAPPQDSQEQGRGREECFGESEQ